MRQQAIQYLAFDVHQATTVASLRDASGSVVIDSKGAVKSAERTDQYGPTRLK